MNTNGGLRRGACLVLTVLGSALVVATSPESGEWPDAWGREVIESGSRAFMVEIDGIDGNEAGCGPVVTTGVPTMRLRIVFEDGTSVYEARCNVTADCLPLRFNTSMEWSDSYDETGEESGCGTKVRAVVDGGWDDGGGCVAGTKVVKNGFDCQATVTGEFEIIAERSDGTEVRVKYRQYELADRKDMSSLGCNGSERRE